MCATSMRGRPFGHMHLLTRNRIQGCFLLKLPNHLEISYANNAPSKQYRMLALGIQSMTVGHYVRTI